MFRTSRPVTDQFFFDRETELERLERLLSKLSAGEPEWLAIVGPRKVGKTSLMLELARRQEHSGVAFVLMDVQETQPVSLEFFRVYALRAVDVLLGSGLGASVETLAHRPVEFRRLLERSQTFTSLPAELRSDIMELPERPMIPAFLRLCLDLPDRLARAVRRRVLVALDEFQELGALSERRGGSDPLPAMRSRWQGHQNVAYVASGSGRTMLTRMVTSRHSPFFQHFSMLVLGPLPRSSARELLVRCSPRGRTITSAMTDRVIDVVGTHPFYLQVLGETITAVEPPYDERTLKMALQSVLFSRTGRLGLYFDNEFQRLVGRSTTLAAVLRKLSEGPVRPAEVSRAIGAPSGATATYLDRLQDTVHRLDDGRYAIVDPVFALWIRWRAPGGSAVPMIVIGTDGEREAAIYLSQLGFEVVYHSVASRGAFDLLALRGSQQLGIQVKRSPLPLRFRKTDWKRMEADARAFRWPWVVIAVSGEQGARVLDPGRASIGRTVRLGPEAVIENLLAWVDEHAFNSTTLA